MDVEQHHGCQSCAGSGKKNESRPTQRPRATPSEGDRTSVKLRNSCRACAESKVRCDREKPTCSRCDTRDLACEYLQSKRPGRVPGISSRQAQAKQAAKKLGQGGDSAGNNIRDTSSVPSPFRLEDFALDLGQQHTRGTTPAYSTTSTHVDGNTAASSPGRDAELGDFYACNAPVAPMAPVTSTPTLDDTLNMVAMDFFWPMEDHCVDLVDMDFDNFANVSASPHTSHGTVLPALHQSSTTVASSSSSLSTLNHPDLLGITAPSLVTSQPANTGPASNSSQSCTCMTRALELLRTLSSNESSDASFTASDQYAQQVLLNNKEAIDASLAMLACRDCINDRFLLMILLMNAVKILTRYTSAATLCRSCTPSSTPSTSDAVEQTSSIPDHTIQLTEISRVWGCVSTPNGTSEPQTSCREAVQRVLRELHRLQRLLAQLTLRRESLREGVESRSLAESFTMRERSGSQMSSRPATSHGVAGSAVLTPHLHENALGLVEDDVRQGLGVLSAVIRDLLNNC